MLCIVFTLFHIQSGFWLQRVHVFSPASRVLHIFVTWCQIFLTGDLYLVFLTYHSGQSFVFSPFLHAAVCLVWLYRFLQHHVQHGLRVRCGVHKSKSIIQYVDYFIERLGEALSLSLQIGGLKECSQGRYVWITRKARMVSEILVFTAATPKKTAI